MERAGACFEVGKLDGRAGISVQGFIDRVSRARDGAIEIHDYKTGARVPSQKVLDEDRQLALYQIGLANEFGSDRPFRLVWHYVARNRTVVSTRTPEQLAALRTTTIARIDEIESTTQFPPKKIALCAWCEYRDVCPLWQSEDSPHAATPATPSRAPQPAVRDEPPQRRPAVQLSLL